MTNPSDPHNAEPDDSGQDSGRTPPSGQNPEPGGYPPPPAYPPPSSGSYPPPPSSGSYPPPSSGSYPPPPGSGSYPPPPSSGSYPPPSSGSYPPPPGSGSYPPPPSSGSYPPPPGSYPPPPGGYGAAGAPAPDPGYGAVAAPQFSVGDALGYAWKRFSANPLPWIVVTLLAGLATGVISGLGNYAGHDSFVIRWIFSLLAAIVGYFFHGAMFRGALDEVGGTKPKVGSFFRFTNVGAVILTALLVAIGTDIGLILCILPGLAFAYLAFWSLAFTVDRDLSPVDAIKASFSVISKNAGTLFPLAIVNVLIMIVGAVLLLIGLLVAVPLVILSSTYAYRLFTGGQIAPVDGPAQTPPPPNYPPSYPPNQY
ncbi:hypothetical protein ACWDTI_01470 [Gordonia sp. NPDC003424]